jgi:hypothetical protein
MRIGVGLFRRVLHMVLRIGSQAHCKMRRCPCPQPKHGVQGLLLPNSDLLCCSPCIHLSSRLAEACVVEVWQTQTVHQSPLR